MIDETLINQMSLSVKMIPDAQLRDYTTFRLGGGCPFLMECPDGKNLAAVTRLLIENKTAFIVIGQGSNLLVSDEGIGSVVLRYCAERKPDITFDGCYVRVSGNTLLDDLARLTAERGIGGVSFCSGIPGTVGGAIAGNAGAFGQQIGDVVKSVELMELNGDMREAQAGELQFTYRSSVLKQTGGVTLSAVLQLKRSKIEFLKKERGRILQLRRVKHPDWTRNPCAGSVFRNIAPTSAARRQAAGWFLEQAGIANLRIGGARLFEKHANIIVADPNTTASDVFALSEKMMAAVREKFGFNLIREIRLLGNF